MQIRKVHNVCYKLRTQNILMGGAKEEKEMEYREVWKEKESVSGQGPCSKHL